MNAPFWIAATCVMVTVSILIAKRVVIALMSMVVGWFCSCL
jgi:hypothetical protein